VSTADIHRGALPFVGIQLVVLILVIVFPQTVTWLVDLSNGMRQNAGGVQSNSGALTIWLYTLVAGFILVISGRILRWRQTPIATQT